jgi:hypothetical protein
VELFLLSTPPTNKKTVAQKVERTFLPPLLLGLLPTVE